MADLKEIRKERLTAWVNQNGGHAVVVRRFDLTQSQASYLSQVMNGYGMGEKAARNWERRFVLQPHSLDGLQSAETRGVAHTVSDVQGIVSTQTIEWGVDVHSLPEKFALVVKDDAMSPLLMPGNKALFSVGATPVAGRPVLLSDGSGDWYIRDYIPKSAKAWTAKARSANYDPLDSVDDQLSIIAVMTGLSWAD